MVTNPADRYLAVSMTIKTVLKRLGILFFIGITMRNSINANFLKGEKMKVCRAYILIICLSVMVIPSIAAAKIIGKVIDQFGQGLGNVHVEILNTGFEADTDKNGKYAIDYVPGKIKLKFSKSNYTTKHMELDIYTKDKFPAAKVEMWKIPPSGIYIVDRKNKRYRKINKSFPVVSKQESHMTSNSLENLSHMNNLAVLAFYANNSGETVIKNGKYEIVDTIPKSIGFFKTGKNGLIFGVQMGAYGKFVKTVFNGYEDEKIDNIGDEKLTVRSISVRDGIYVFSEVKKISDNFGAEVIAPTGVYFPLTAGTPPRERKIAHHKASSSPKASPARGSSSTTSARNRRSGKRALDQAIEKDVGKAVDAIFSIFH